MAKLSKESISEVRKARKGEHLDAACGHRIALGTHSHSNCSGSKCGGKLTANLKTQLQLERRIRRVGFFDAHRREGPGMQYCRFPGIRRDRIPCCPGRANGNEERFLLVQSGKNEEEEDRKS
jgi:hypothetical protein